ncbi:MAG TPA: SDR family NAD(P)-dependent oxidoreductase [Candidatus Cybelea sp.]|nr:SDR family NAD(P)-dependent oxidoreductase [Candidatus Cybelea sp.]
MTKPGIALVIGATGGIGGEVARALLAQGWEVRALHRDPEKARQSSSRIGKIEWVAGDAMNRADVIAAAEGASVIFHGANPPAYRNWRGLALPMLANAIAAAKASGARLVFPGNIYNYGPDAWPVVDEASPQHPATRKGAIRVEMEQMLRHAADDGVRSLVVRAGDFFGVSAPSSWFQTVMVRPGRRLRSVVYPGARDVGHAWAYLPDLAQAIVRLIAIEARLPAFETVHFGGQWVRRGVEMAEAVRHAAGDPSLPIRRFPWPVVYIAAPFVNLFREMIEMRYLWRTAVQLDNRKLVALIGPEPHTPLDVAVRETLRELGCVPASPAPSPLPSVAL